MKNLMVTLENEMMSFDELDSISGGTVGEVEELWGIICDGSADTSICNTIVDLGTSVITPAKLPSIKLKAIGVTSILKKEFGIEADCSVGLLATGAFSRKNYYQEISTGKMLSHSEVVNRVRISNL